MRKSSAVLAAVLLGLANAGLAADSSTGTTHPGADMQMDDGSRVHNDSSMSTDSSMSSDGAISSDSTAPGRPTGEGKRLNKGKTPTAPVEEGGRIDR